MTRSQSFRLVLGAAPFLLIGCGNSSAAPPATAVDMGDATSAVEAEPSPGGATAAAKKAGLPFEIERIEHKTAHVAVEVSYPRFSSPPGQDDRAVEGLNHDLGGRIRNEADHMVETAAADASGGGSAAVNYTLKQGCKVAINNGAFVSVKCTGQSSSRGVSSSIDTGDVYLLTDQGAHRLSFEDLFVDAGRKQLKQRCEGELKKQGAANVVAGEAPVLINPGWLIDEHGITIVFEPDRVGPKEHRVLIPLADLRPMVHPAVRSGLEGKRPPGFDKVHAVVASPKGAATD